MKTAQSKFVLPAIIMAMIFTAFALSIVFENKAQVAFGSTIMGNDYKATTTTSASFTGSATVAKVIKSNSGSLGSVIITGTTTGVTLPLRIYDATTSTSTIYKTVGPTLVASFPTGSGQGTYQYDVDMQYGIVVDVPPSWAGTYTITYR